MVSTLLIVVDGLRASDVSKMPFITELARRGVSYDHARSVAPSLTFPAAASLATGQAPAAAGIMGNYIWAAGRLIDAACPDNLDLLRARRGNRLLPVPTLSEHLADHGRKLVAVGTGSNGGTLLLNPGAIDGHGAVIGAYPFQNDAFYAQPDSVRNQLAGNDPRTADGPFPQLDWAVDLIVDYVMPELAPDVVVLWSGELDDIQHDNGADRPASDDALLEIDRRLRRLVGRVRQSAPHTDIIVTSDHGFSNATHTIDVAETASWIPLPISRDVRIVDNNGGLLVYAGKRLRPEEADAVIEAVMSAGWSGPTFAERSKVPGALSLDDLRSGPTTDPDLLAYVSLTYHDHAGELRVGLSARGAGEQLAGGHGSTSSADMHIPLVLNGPSFRTAEQFHFPADHLDIPPTICWLIGLPVPPSMSGRVLSEASPRSTGTGSAAPESRRVVAERSAADVTTAHFQQFGGRHYFLSAERCRP
ncbi:alkaline phosphatase family protein [Rhodococcus sp. NPDC059968]|uniref:alkaline phosphatase family protein n=1 Tax=Rhodococcus sp. NPDC059968 TaxID=3347017 RepID=UPI00366B885E